MVILHTTSELKFLDSIQYPSISFEKGTFSFITGKSGCGKSTYLKFLNGLLSAESAVFFYGKPVSYYPILEYRKRVLLTPQSIYLIDGTIKENFLFYYENRRQDMLSDEDIKKFLSICCLDMPLDTLCQNMSGGERQRVFLAIFLSFAAEVLLLDEPTSALDENTALTLLGNIKKYCQEQAITVVCVCHNPQLAQRYADQIIELGGNKHESSY